MPRALRLWLAHHEGDSELPCERVFWSTTPKTSQTPRQAAMARGIETVWGQILERLQARGVQLQTF